MHPNGAEARILVYMILPFHILSLLVTLYFIVRSDLLAVQWVRGKSPMLDLDRLKRYHYAVAVGLIAMIITGVSMAIPAVNSGSIYTTSLAIKLSFVALLIVNSFVINKHLVIPSKKKFVELSNREKYILFASGAASTIGWLGALIAAFFLEIE